jgi:predicted O-methyltransferase YrrM
MDDTENLQPPAMVVAIEQETVALGFPMASERKTGSLLRTLAASKPAGAFLELGTGTGLATAWILDGMDQDARLTTVDNDATVVAIAKRYLGQDSRVTFHLMDGAAFLKSLREQRFDYIFADTWAGKYDHVEEALRLLKPGGLYIIDDMLPQPSWPAGHAPKVPQLIALLEARNDLVLTKMHWATGMIVATKKGHQ